MLCEFVLGGICVCRKHESVFYAPQLLYTILNYNYSFLVLLRSLLLPFRRVSKKKFDPLAEFSRLAGKLKDKMMNPTKGNHSSVALIGL